jgi:predicted glycosyltransferase involved in capsule biosynthesis
VPRNIFEQVGGFDEKFVGWGGEDNAFWHSCKIVSGEPLRIDGFVYHLWHEKADKSNRRVNNGRWLTYKSMTTRSQLGLMRNSTHHRNANGERTKEWHTLI